MPADGFELYIVLASDRCVSSARQVQEREALRTVSTPAVPNTAENPTLADYTRTALILPQLQSKDRDGALWELSETFGRLDDGQWAAQQIFDAALARERQMSTAMEFGVAFPHVRSAACARLQFALGRCARPITWGKHGSLPVRFIFFTAVPNGDATGYIKMVSSMTRLSKQPGLLDRLKSSRDAGEMLAVLRTLPVRK